MRECRYFLRMGGVWIAVLVCLLRVDSFAQGRWQSVGIIHARSVQAIRYIDANTDIVAGGLQSTNNIIRYTNRGLDIDIYNDYDTTALRFTDVSFPTHTIGYVVGWQGAVLKTINTSNSWFYLNRYLPLSVRERDFNGTYFVNSKEGFVVGGQDDTVQTILKTSDGGTTWSVQRDMNGHWLTSVCFISATTGFAVGKGGTLLKTTNGGTNWNVVSIPGAVSARDFNKVYFKNASVGFIVGGSEFGLKQTILQTTDGGNTWNTIVDADNQEILNDIGFKDALHGFAVGNKGVIKATTDGGNTWNTFALPDSINDTIRNLRTVHFFNTYTGAFGGEWGKYFVYTEDLPTAPSVRTDSVTLFSDNSVRFSGSVNPNGINTHVAFEYGTTIAFENSTQITPDSIAGNSFQSVSATTSSLSPGRYYFRIRASGPGGDSAGIILSFTIGLPVAVTGDASVDPTNQVRLFGRVHPHGSSATVVFEYGQTISLGNTIPVFGNPISGNSDRQVSVITPALSEGIYYYRVKATAGTDSSLGELRQFYIGANPIPNFDFEFWGEDTLVTLKDWLSYSIRVGVSFDGSRSIIMDGRDNKDGFGVVLMGTISNNFPVGGVPFTARPDSLAVHYKSALLSGYPALVFIILKKNGISIAQQAFYIQDSTHGAFVRKAFPIFYTDSTTLPDSVILAFVSNDPLFGLTVNPDNRLEIDNVSFTGTTQNVPNPGFEELTNIITQYPISWMTFDRRNRINLPQTVVRTDKAQHGQYAAKVQNLLSLHNPGVMQSHVEGGNDIYGPIFPVNGRVSSLNGYYIFNPDGDTAQVSVNVYKAGAQVGKGAIELWDNDTVYKPFSVRIFYDDSTVVPDSANISITSINDNVTYSVKGNSILFIDNISFDGLHQSDTLIASGFIQHELNALLLRIYPNPAVHYIAVKWPAGRRIAGAVVFDINGKAMNAPFIANAYNDVLMINVSDLPSGLFILSIQTGADVYTGKFIIHR